MPPPIRAAARFQIAYREATDEDLPFLAEVFFSTRREEVAQTGWPPAQQLAFLRQQQEAQHAHYSKGYAGAEWLVIERKGEHIGRLYLHEGIEELRVIDIALLPEARGQGVGEAILRDVGAAAASRGKRVTIHVERFNPARHLYARLGFVRIEEGEVYDKMEWRPAAEG